MRQVSELVHLNHRDRGTAREIDLRYVEAQRWIGVFAELACDMIVGEPGSQVRFIEAGEHGRLFVIVDADDHVAAVSKIAHPERRAGHLGHEMPVGARPRPLDLKSSKLVARFEDLLDLLPCEHRLSLGDGPFPTLSALW